MSRWKSENRDRILQRRRELHAQHNWEKHKQKREEYLANSPIRARAQIMRKGMIDRAKERGLEFDRETLTVEYVFQWLKREPHCPCCGKKLDTSFKLDGTRRDASPSIDRLRPERGYTVDNVALICWRCNNLKRDATAQELRAVADWMASIGLD